MYNILEARIEFKGNNIQCITVLVDCTSNQSKPLSDVRAIYADTKASCGYMSIPPLAKISESLLQEVAGYGMKLVDRDEIFPKWKAKHI